MKKKYVKHPKDQCSKSIYIMNKLKYIGLQIVLLLSVINVQAETIAVTDLTYAEQITGYIHIIDYHNKASHHNQENIHYNNDNISNSGTSNSLANGQFQTDYTEIENKYNYIEYNELHKFVGDIKGEILKNTAFQLSQAKPYTAKGDKQIFDIISRIKKDYYPHADYVLFGIVNDIDFRNEFNPILGTNTLSNSFSLRLVAEFSLIDTKTYEVISAFSANGEGQDVRIVTSGGQAIPSRAKVVSEVSKSLGINVVQQLKEQLNNNDRY